MKKITLYTILFLSTICILPSCDKGFEETNTNKTLPIALDPAFLMNNAIIGSSAPAETMIFELAIVQQVITPFGGVLGGGFYSGGGGGASYMSALATSTTLTNGTNGIVSSVNFASYYGTVLIEKL
jgi:hypothetical protein